MPRKRPRQLRDQTPRWTWDPPAPRRRVQDCCGKTTFADRLDASHALTRIQRRVDPDQEYVPRRVYQCDNGNYHLTHYPDPTPSSRYAELRERGQAC